MRVLFLGNSYTIYHNLPEMVAVLGQAAKVKIETRMVARGGFTLRQLWDQTEARAVIREGNWDYVVLQEHSLLGGSFFEGAPAVNDPDFFWETARMYDAEIRKAKGRTVLYLTWARRAHPEHQSSLNFAYATLAQELNALLAPVGPAWQRAREADPALVLFDNDGAHPGPAGSYLAAVTILDTILGRRTAGLPARITGHPVTPPEEVPDRTRTADLVSLPADRAEWLQRAAGEAVQRVGGLSTETRPAANRRAPLPAGRRPTADELKGLWRGPLKFYSTPATFELQLDSLANVCRGRFTITHQGNDRRITGPVENCRVTDVGIRFLIRDHRGLNLTESYWGQFTGELIAGYADFQAVGKTSRMTGTFELRKQRP